MAEAEERAAVIAAARTWLGTPFHDGAELKGVGVDCAHLLSAAYFEAGLIPAQEIAHYSPQWMLHNDVERFEDHVLKFAHEIEGPPKPGDVVLYKIGRLYAHGAIVVAWPTLIIHAFKVFGFVAETSSDEADLQDVKKHPRRFFSIW